MSIQISAECQLTREAMPYERDSLLHLQQMLNSFVGGKDRSVRAANEIEAVLLGSFPDDDGFEDLLVALASYRPGGGEYLHDEDSLRRICSDALVELQSRLTA